MFQKSITTYFIPFVIVFSGAVFSGCGEDKKDDPIVAESAVAADGITCTDRFIGLRKYLDDRFDELMKAGMAGDNDTAYKVAAVYVKGCEIYNAYYVKEESCTVMTQESYETEASKKTFKVSDKKYYCDMMRDALKGKK